MSDLTARAAYIKGLADGMKLDENKDSSKLMLAMIEFLEEIAENIDALDGETGFLADCVEQIDGELDEIAEILSDCDCVADCGCGFDHDGGEDDRFEFVCPTCQKSVVLDMDAFEDEATCPNCGEEIEFDFEFEDENEETD